MSSERLTSAPEQSEKSTENLDTVRQERLDALRQDTPEQDPQAHAQKRAEAARETIKHQDAEPEPDNASERVAQVPNRPVAFLDQHQNYSQTLATIQRKLTPVSRNFSKVIHTPIIEKTSEVLETTIARPSVTLGTTWTALIVGAIFYFTARHYGYALSGSELLFSFIVGALLGLVLEGLWRSLKRR